MARSAWVDRQVPKTTRQVQQGGEVPIGVELPAFRLTSDVLTAPPWVHWQASAVRIQGDGVTAELGRTSWFVEPTHYDLSGAVDLQASTEVITGLVGGWLPDRLQVSARSSSPGMQLAISRWMVAPTRDLTYRQSRLARVDWDGALWEAVAAHLTVAQGRLTIDDAASSDARGWSARPETFIDLQGPRRDFQCTWRPSNSIPA